MAAQSRPPRFLLTRPAAQGARFAESLRQRFPGAEITESPLIAPRFLAPPLPPGPFAAAIFSSETGVEAARRLGGPLSPLAFCVGARTAKAAEDAGYRVQSAGLDAEDLLVTILHANPAGRLIHLHGAETRGNLAERLNSAGIVTYSIVVYAQDALPLTAEARAMLAADHAVFVPLFSPRTAQLFTEEAADARAALHVAALSPAVRSSLHLPTAALATAAHPDAASMLDALSALVSGAGGA